MTQFESKVCTRCGGSGKYSFNLMHGDMCYGCQGTGIQLTKRGQAAQKFFTESLMVDVESLEVGMAIKFMTHDKYFKKIELIDFDESRNLGKKHICGYFEGEAGSHKLYYIQGTGGCSSQFYPGQKVRIMFSKEDKAKKLQEALEYQNTLTTTGKVKKIKKG